MRRRQRADLAREREDLAIEFLLGKSSPKGRTYFKPNSKRELLARATLARLMIEEASHGYFTQLVAAHINPPGRSAIVKRRIIFQQLGKRGRPAITDRYRVEIAAFMHERRRAGRNRNGAISDAKEKFKISRRTVLNIWRFFRLKNKG